MGSVGFGCRWITYSRLQTVALRLQVYEEYLLWALKYINMTYFVLFGAPGLEYGPGRISAGFPSFLDFGLWGWSIPTFWLLLYAGPTGT